MALVFFGVIALDLEIIFRMLDWFHRELLMKDTATCPVPQPIPPLHWIWFYGVLAVSFGAFLVLPIAAVVVLVRLEIRIARRWLTPFHLEEVFSPLRKMILIGPYVERSLGRGS